MVMLTRLLAMPLLAGAIVGGLAAQRASGPNLVVILTDDQGYADVGFHGCRDIPTPHIDSIAHDRVHFTNAYVSFPVCGPSLAGLITGRDQDRFGACRNPTIDQRWRQDECIQQWPLAWPQGKSVRRRTARADGDAVDRDDSAGNGAR